MYNYSPCPSIDTHPIHILLSAIYVGSSVAAVLEQRAIAFESVLEVVADRLWNISGTTTSILLLSHSALVHATLPVTPA